MSSEPPHGEVTLVGFSTGGGEVARYVARHGTARIAQLVLVSCIAAFSATDFRADLDAVDVPTLIIHGDDDQVVPYSVGGEASAARIKGSRLITYPGAPHGITDTHKEQLGRDLLAFLKEYDA